MMLHDQTEQKPTHFDIGPNVKNIS